MTTHDGRPMRYEHGVRAAYVLDKCRCEPCRLANNAYMRDLRNNPHSGRVSATPAREHLKYLSENGVGLMEVAEISGVSVWCIRGIVFGSKRPGGRLTKPYRRISRENSERLLAVTPSQGSGMCLVDAEPTWELIRQMGAAGIPKMTIAAAIGKNHGQLRFDRKRIRLSFAQSIQAFYNDWASGKVEVRKVRSRKTAVPPEQKPMSNDGLDFVHKVATLLEERNDRTWQRSAACRNLPPHVFFPAKDDKVLTAKVKRICGYCVVRPQCLAANINETDGVFGGTTPYERKQLRVKNRQESSTTAA